MENPLPECPRHVIPDKYAEKARVLGIHAGDCICDQLRAAIADAIHEYDKHTYKRCAGHMRTARAEALDEAREAVASCTWDKGVSRDFDAVVSTVITGALAAIDALKEKP